MSRPQESKPLYQPKRPRRSIKVDRIHPRDFTRYVVTHDSEGREILGGFFCESCSHFNSSNTTCTLGYRAQHTRAIQLKSYELSGTMVLCRAIEID